MIENSDNQNKEELKQACYLRLRHSIQALAQPAQVQLSLFPDFVCKTDELALDFNHWYEWVLGSSETRAKGNISEELDNNQKSSLHALDSCLDKMSGQANSHLWTEAALSERSEWEEIRQLAKAVLDSFAWPLEVPPSCEHEYIGGKSQG